MCFQFPLNEMHLVSKGMMLRCGKYCEFLEFNFDSNEFPQSKCRANNEIYDWSYGMCDPFDFVPIGFQTLFAFHFRNTIEFIDGCELFSALGCVLFSLLDCNVGLVHPAHYGE